MIQYEDHGPRTRAPRTGRSLEPAPAAIHGVAIEDREGDHQRGGRAALLGGGRTPPFVMPIDSPHEPAIRRKRELPGGCAAPPGLCPCWRSTVRWASPPRKVCSKPITAEGCPCLPVCHSRTAGSPARAPVVPREGGGPNAGGTPPWRPWLRGEVTTWLTVG